MSRSRGRDSKAVEKEEREEERRKKRSQILMRKPADMITRIMKMM